MVVGEGVQERPESVGERIRRLRTEQGKSLRDIEGPGADHAHISRVEAGHRRATDAFLQTVARSLGVTVDYLRDSDHWDARNERRAELADIELRLRIADRGDAEITRQLRDLHARAYAEGERDVALRCRLLIGCSASHRGDHALAVRELERALRRGQVSCLVDPDVYVSLARSLTALGRADEAVQLLESCVSEAETTGDDLSFVRFSVLTSYALVDAGDTRQAKKFVSKAVARSGALNDLNSTVRVYWARARVAWAERDWTRGRANADRAIALCEALQDRDALLRLHLLRAEIGLMAGDLDAAEASIEVVAEQIAFDTHPQDVGTLRWQQSFLAATRGDYDEAVALAQAAIDLLDSDAAWQARAKWALAHALAAAGRYEEAAAAYEDAYELVLIERRFIAEFLRDWAATLLELGRTEEAARVFMSAVDKGTLTSVDLR